MSPQEAVFWTRVTNRARAMQPELQRALLKALEYLKLRYSETEVARLIQNGEAYRIVETQFNEARLNAAYAVTRDRIRTGVGDAFKYIARDLPKQSTLNIAFDILNPRVIDAVRQLETKSITTLNESIRETVKQHVEAGLASGKGPRVIARSLRDVIGLAPNQELAVRHFEEALRSGDMSKALGYKLRDKRFDKSLKSGTLSDERITRMVDTYRKRMIAWNAETNARTAALDAMKLGQKLAIDDAVRMGVYDPNRLVKTWVGVMDERERAEHVAMEKETVPYLMFYSNGEMIPGESTFCCRCISRYSQTRSP